MVSSLWFQAYILHVLYKLIIKHIGFSEDTNKPSTKEKPKKKEDTTTSSVEKESNRKGWLKTKRKSGHH